MLAAWVEQYPVQSPGDWIGFNLWTARDWRRDMIVSYSPADHGRELAVRIHDRGVRAGGSSLPQDSATLSVNSSSSGPVRPS